MTGVFTINYPATMAVIDRMTKLVEKLTRINERYESKISTLSRCRGTAENPHNHDSQIASYRKIISNNSEDIVDLELLISQIFSLMVNTKMTDFYLTQLIKNLMSGDSNVPNPETSASNSFRAAGISKSELITRAAGLNFSGGVPQINGAYDYLAYKKILENPNDHLNALYRVIQDQYYIYGPVSIGETYVGGSRLQEHSGTLTKEQQLNLALLSIYAEVDYTLILGTMLHESSWQTNPPDWNGPGSSASGCMQLLDGTYNYYAKEGGAYYDEYSDMRALAEELGADFSHKDDFLANATVGICSYMEWQSCSAFGADMSQVVNHYGNGSDYNEGITSENIYPVLSPSTIEILYYRDLLAIEAEVEPWYIGDLYDKDGNRLE